MKRFYLIHPQLGTLYLDDENIAALAQEHGYKRVSSKEYGNAKKKLGKQPLEIRARKLIENIVASPRRSVRG